MRHVVQVASIWEEGTMYEANSRRRSLILLDRLGRTWDFVHCRCQQDLPVKIRFSLLRHSRHAEPGVSMVHLDRRL